MSSCHRIIPRLVGVDDPACKAYWKIVRDYLTHLVGALDEALLVLVGSVAGLAERRRMLPLAVCELRLQECSLLGKLSLLAFQSLLCSCAVVVT